MLHLREQDLVSGTEIGCAPGVSHQVDSLGRPTSKNDFVGALGVNKTRGACSRALESGRGAVAQLVDAAVDVGIVAFVIVAQRVQDLDRLLGRCCIVQVDQRVPMHALVQSREILARRAQPVR